MLRLFFVVGARTQVECEAAINDQINTEYSVSYIYHALSAYFARDNVALPGLAAYFKESSAEEREHAELLMDYQVQYMSPTMTTCYLSD